MVLSPAVTGADRAWMVTRRVDRKDDVLFLLSPGEDGKVVRQAFPSRPDMLNLIELTDPLVGRPDLVPEVLAAELAGATSWIAVPNHARIAGEGTLILVSYTPGVDLGVHLEIASAVGLQALTAYDKAFLFAQVQELAVVDELTGIPNRRHFFEVAGRDVATAKRHGRVLTAVMIDIDHFKQVNDAYGHPTGDDVIRGVVERLTANVRGTDLVGRYGGEEFALLLPDADPASTLPDRLRQCVAEAPIETRSGPVPVTISVGLAHLTPDDADIEAVLGRADAALYAAKRAGRNRVVTA